MPTIDLAPNSPFNCVRVKGLRPRKSSLFQEALERLHALGGSSQILDALGVAGLEHMATAARLTAASFGSGKNLARSPATEFLLYASASRQIKEAISRLGVNSSSSSWVLITIQDTFIASQKATELFLSYGSGDDRLMGITPKKRAHLMELYGICGEELAFAKTIHGSSDSALKALVMERVALSELYR